MKFRQRTIYLMVVLLLGMFVQQSYGYIPSRQAKFITYSNVNANEMTINWVRGNGQNAIVLMKQDDALDVSGLGEDEPTGVANSVFSSADTYADGKLVYKGTGTSVTVTGLLANKTYHVMVLEYNVDGSNWDINNASAVLNPRSRTTLQGTLGLPTGMSTVARTGTTATIQWTNDGSLAVGYYIDVRKESNAILPAYDLLDIGLPSTKRFFITGLPTPSTAYEWRLRPYDAQGRVGAATAWQSFSSLQVDPTVTLFNSSSVCGGAGYLTATWPLGTTGGASYYPSPALGTWTALAGPVGAGAPDITTNPGAGTSTGNIVVNKAGVYSFQFEISVGEYYSSTWATYTFNAPWTDITTSPNPTSTCGDYFALSATTTGCNAGTGTWSYYGPNGGTGSFTNSTAQNTNFQLTGATPTYGNYTFRWTSTYVGLTSYDEIVVEFAQLATATVTTASVETCGLTYTLDGNTPVSGATGSWTLLGGPLGGTASFSPNATTPTAQVTVNNGGYYSFAWTVSNACATVGVNKHVTFYAPPSTANAGIDAQNCGLTYTLAGNNPTAGTGVWTGPAGVTFGNSATYNSTVTVPSFYGSSTYHSFTWTIDNGVCDSNWEAVTVSFYNSPVASVTTTVGPNCTLTIPSLDGNDPSTIGTGSWYVYQNIPTGQPNSPAPPINPGLVTFGDPTVYNTSVTVSQQGLYSFVWQVSNGNCTPAKAGKQVTFYAEPNTANAGTDTQNCGRTYQLSGNEATAGTVGTWTKFAGPGVVSFGNPSVYNTTVTTPTFAGSDATYTFRWSIGNGSCTTKTDDVVVTFYNSPVASVSNTAGTNCGLSIVHLDGNSPSIGTGSWTKVSGPGTAQFGNSQSYNSSVSVDQEGAYSFVWTVSNGVCTPAQAGKQVTFYAEPDLANAGTDAAICGLNYTLAGNNPTAGIGTWTASTGVSFSPSATSYNAVVTAPTYNNYTLTWTIGNGTCQSNSNEVTVSFKISPDAYAGVDHDACTGVDNYYTMTATYGIGETGTWTQSPNNPATASFDNINYDKSKVWFTVAGTYNFTWTTSNGSCQDTDNLTLAVYDPIVIPETATISGDETPVGGTSNIQYSIPNYNDDLTYSWYYTKSDPNCSVGLPTINDNGNNVVYLDYLMNACDGTLSVSLTDKCNLVTTIRKEIDVINIPVIISSVLNTANTTVTIGTNLSIYTNCASDPLTTNDFQLFFNQNGGTATGVTLNSITGTNPYTFNISVAGTPNGCETIEIKPIANAVWDVTDGCLAMLNDQTAGLLSLYNKTTPSVATNVGVTPYAKQATINWTVPTGAKSLVVVNTNTTFNNPSNYTVYPANASYGTQTYSPGLGYTVFNGTGNSVTVVGLADNSTYKVAVWTYNEACGDNNESFNMTPTTSTFGTKKLATKLVAVNPPTIITSGTAFNLEVQAQDANGNPAYPGCDETLYLTGSAALATTTLQLTGTTATFGNAVYTNEAGACNHTFTFDDNGTCSYELSSGTFTANVAPTEPTTHAYRLEFTNTQKTQIDVGWKKGNGTGRILLAKLANNIAIPLTTLVDGTDYSAISTTSSASSFNINDLVSNTGIKGIYRTDSDADAAQKVTVKDLEAGKTYNFRVIEYNKPSCNTNWSLSNFKSSGNASMNPRNGSTLAKMGSFNGVEIAYFDGKSYQLQVDLNWEAITEDGIAYYVIYRQDMYSDDVIKVGSANVDVSAGAGSKYTVTDDKGLTLGETYLYRLVAVDFSGQTSDLAETFVTVNDDINSIINLTIGSVNPNPVKDVVRFDIGTTKLSPVFIEIRNVEGKVIYTEERMVNGVSTVEYKMNVKAAGTYFITVTSGSEGSVTSFIYQP